MKITRLVKINISNEIEIALFGFPIEWDAFLQRSVFGWKLIIYLSPQWPPIYFRGEWAK